MCRGGGDCGAVQDEEEGEEEGEEEMANREEECCLIPTAS